MKVSIIIPAWNNWEWTEKCIGAIRANTAEESYRLIIIDNGSTAEVAQKLQGAVRDGDLYHRFGKNLGYIQAVNAAMKMTSGDAVLMNNDVIVQRGWLRPLVAAGEYGVVSPVNNNSSTLQNVKRLREHLKDERIPEVTEQSDGAVAYMKDTYAGRVLDVVKLAFFCVLMRRAAWMEVGEFNEVFGYGEGEDRDWSIRALGKKIRLGIALDSVVYHACHKSFDLIGPEVGHNPKRNDTILAQMYETFDFRKDTLE